MTKMRFDGRVALVTGGGRGIGRSEAIMLAERGCNVIVADAGLNVNGGHEPGDPAGDVISEIAATGGTAVAFRGNVLCDAEAMVHCAIENFGRLDIVINNAGAHGTLQLLPESNAEVWQRTVETHFFGTVGVCRAAWPHLVASGAGRIVNTASSATFGSKTYTDYGSAKAAIFGFSRSLALEGNECGVNINCILPSGFTRGMEKHIDPDLRVKMRELLRPEHIAAFVAWLVHQETNVSGEAFNVGGGRAARIVIAAGPGVKTNDSTPEQWRAASTRLYEGTLARRATMIDNFLDELDDIDASTANMLRGS